jgi:hypothetical protein
MARRPTRSPPPRRSTPPGFRSLKMAEHPIAADRVVGTPITQAVLLITTWRARTQAFKGIEVTLYEYIFLIRPTTHAFTAMRKLPEHETQCCVAFLPTPWTYPCQDTPASADVSRQDARNIAATALSRRRRYTALRYSIDRGHRAAQTSHRMQYGS